MHFTTFLMHNVILWKYSRNLSSSTYSSHSLRSLKKYHLFSLSQVSNLQRNTNLSQQMFCPLHENRHISNHNYPTHHLDASFELGPSLYLLQTTVKINLDWHKSTQKGSYLKFTYLSWGMVRMVLTSPLLWQRAKTFAD